MSQWVAEFFKPLWVAVPAFCTQERSDWSHSLGDNDNTNDFHWKKKISANSFAFSTRDFIKQYVNLGNILEGRVFLTTGHLTEQPLALHNTRKSWQPCFWEVRCRAAGFICLVRSRGAQGEQWHAWRLLEWSPHADSPVRVPADSCAELARG